MVWFRAMAIRRARLSVERLHRGSELGFGLQARAPKASLLYCGSCSILLLRLHTWPCRSCRNCKLFPQDRQRSSTRPLSNSARGWQDREYMESITRSMSMGINVIDCAANYRNMRSELLIGHCLSMAIKQGIVARNEVIVCSKAGFLAFDYRESIDPYTYIDEKYIKTNLFKREEFLGGCHCLSPAYLKNQLELSRRNMGLETIDIYFIHNPETQLSQVSRSTLLPRIKAAMQAMEECCAEGKLAMYGIATWNGFRVNASHKQHLPLEEILSYAKDIAGDDHHFKVIQAPYNSRLQQAAKEPSQPVRGRRMPLLHAAHHLGLSVMTSATLNQGLLHKNLDPDVRKLSADLGEQRTDAQAAVQFVRTTPGIVTAFVGMRQVMHVEENGALIRHPAHPRS